MYDSQVGVRYEGLRAVRLGVTKVFEAELTLGCIPKEEAALKPAIPGSLPNI